MLSTTTSTTNEVDSSSSRSSVLVDTNHNDNRYKNNSNNVYDDRGGSEIEDSYIDLSSLTSPSYSTNDRKMSRGKHRRKVVNQYKQVQQQQQKQEGK